MDENDKIILEGRKTFFIVPDATMFPDTYLEDYLARGYETYIINDDRSCPLPLKVETIVGTFKDSILFFYIDSIVEGLDWKVYIRELQEKYGDSVLIGVLYAKRSEEEDMHSLERYYLFDVGIKCGCISMEYQKAKNFALIDKVMYANQACGRRKNVRALCDMTSAASFMLEKKKYTGKVSDVSLSHFSCVFDLDPPLPMYEKVYDILVDVNGLHFHTDAILIDRRMMEDRYLFIFIFAQPNGKQGLDDDVKQRLSQKIYNLITEKIKNMMKDLFIQANNNALEKNKNLFRN